MKPLSDVWGRITAVQQRTKEMASSARRSLLWMLLARQRRVVRWAIILVAVQLLMSVLIGNATVAMVDNAIVDQALPLWPYVTYIAKLAALVFVVGITARQLTVRLIYQLEFDLRAWLYTRVQWAELDRLDKVASGQLVTRAMTDVRMVQQVLQIAPTFVGLIPLVLGLLLYLLWLSPPLAVLASAALPLNLWLLTRFRVRLFGLSWAELNERAEVASAVDEPVRGVRVMKAFGREEHERARLRDRAVNAYRYAMTRVRLIARYDVLLKVIPLTVNAVVLVAGARLVAGDDLSLGVFLIAFQVTGGVTQIAQAFDEAASGWQYLRGAEARLAEVLAMGVRPREGRPGSDEFTAFELRDVDLELAGNKILEGFTLRLEPGHMVAVTGPPGSGKTLLTSLIGGLVEPTSGEILVDGEPMSELDITTIRTMVRVLAEEPMLFSGTLRDNLDLGAAWTVTDEEIDVALHAAGADDIVREMPEGLNTIVGDRGLTLSGGQRQRLALARALVARPRIVVLDEALSAVNPSHQVEILRRMQAALPDAAIVYLSRGSGLTPLADTVVELPKQRVAVSTALLETPLASPEADTGSDLIDIVKSLELSDDDPLVRDQECEIDSMPKFRTLLRYLALPLVGVGLLLFVNSLAELAPQILFDPAADAAEDADTGLTDIIGIAVLLTGAVYALSAFALRVAAMKVTQSVVYLLRRRIFQRLTNLGIDFYDRELPGEVATRVVNDLDTILAFAQERGYRFLASLAKFVTGLMVVVVIAPEVFPTVLGVALVLVILTIIQMVVGLRAFNRTRDDIGRTVSTFEEHYFGRSELRGCGAVRKASRRFVEEAWELRQSRRWALSVGNVYSELVQFVTYTGGAIILFSAGNAALSGTIAVGTALSVRLVSQVSMQTLPFMGSVYLQLLDAKVSWDRLRQPFDTPILPADGPDSAEAPRLEGGITFEDVHFTYPHTTKPVLHDVSFNIPPGTVAALVGFTGAGKSSITKLLLRTYDPTQGRVLLDGVDIRSYESRSYRRRLGVVPQEAFLFKGTVRSNIAYARPDASLEDVEAAARAVGAHEVLSGLEDGYEHRVEEEARNLTAAQRQLIALARVWLAHPDVLILDEATSSLDAELEAKVLDAIAELGVTTLAVTHRDNVAERADLTIVLEAGRVVEIGRPDELIGSDSAYDRLWVTDDILVGAGARSAGGTRTQTRRGNGKRAATRKRAAQRTRPLRARSRPAPNGEGRDAP